MNEKDVSDTRNKNGDEDEIEEIEIDIEKLFPNLSKELKDKMSRDLGINAVRFHDTSSEGSGSSELKNPDVISFLRRCETEIQGIEIINYLVKRNEISKEYAEELKIQLKSQGIRSFGSKKDAGYYDKTY